MLGFSIQKLLVLAAVIAMVWANSPWADFYHPLWHDPDLTMGIGDFQLSKPLELWISDGLMAIFFFVVGLEIKRDSRHGAAPGPGAGSEVLR